MCSSDLGTAQLLAGELLANAVTFTAHLVTCEPWEPGGICLSARCHPGAVVIRVRDTDPAPPVLTGAGPDAESGRGLMLVQSLSTEWGHYLLPSGGKVVYCVISTGHGRRGLAGDLG